MKLNYNEFVLRLMATMIFHYGCKASDLMKLKIKNYVHEIDAIKFDIRPDKLLMEESIFLPVHHPVDVWIDNMLDIRRDAGNISGEDFLFCFSENNQFRPLNKIDIKSFFIELSNQLGAKIDERKLSASHSSYYLSIGWLSPIIDNRISNRTDHIACIPRLYTQATFKQQRQAHFASFCRLADFLRLDYLAKIKDGEQDVSLMLGGKRAVGRRVIKNIFSYFERHEI